MNRARRRMYEREEGRIKQGKPRFKQNCRKATRGRIVQMVAKAHGAWTCIRMLP